MRQLNGARRVLAVALLGFTAVSVRATDLEMAKQVDKLKISGDFRLRQETFVNDTEGNGKTGRNRQRLRLRVAVELPLPDYLTVKTRFASGTGEQTSTNQSFDNLDNQKQFWIDRAYMDWRPMGGTDKLKLFGGRMANPLWLQYSSDIVWDDDLNPEGFAEGTEFLAGPVKLFGNAMQMVVDEDNGNSGDQWELSTQIGAEVQLPFESRLRVGFAQHQWINESTTTHRLAAGDFGQGGTFPTTPTKRLDGNRRYASGVLMNEFRVNELTANLSFWVAQIPVSVQGTFINNVDALDQFNTPKKADKGSQVGVIVGKASAAKSWEAAYFMKKSETDSTVADVADSDFGVEGGTGRKGSIMWVAYNPADWCQFKLKAFSLKLEDKALPPGPSGGTNGDYDLTRIQIDYSVKF